MPQRDHGGTGTDDLTYFEDQFSSNATFWARMGKRPDDLRGRRVLDLGCGHGAMTFDLAAAGASVVGVDLDEGHIAFAQRQLNTQRFERLAERVQFIVADLATLDGPPFDYAVSKDTFEHVEDLTGLLDSIHTRMAPAGRLFAGFSPLYYSPYGDHGRTGLRLPWLHALLPQRLVLRAASKLAHRQVGTLHDIGLNGLTPAQFRDAFAASRFTVEQLAYNRGSQRLMPVLSALRRVPWLEPYATVSIYAVLKA